MAAHRRSQCSDPPASAGGRIPWLRAMLALPALTMLAASPLSAALPRLHLVSICTAAGPQLARTEAPQQVLVMSDQGPMVRDARMMELLAEHKQFGGTSALQMPSGFLRNATFETSQGERR